MCSYFTLIRVGVVWVCVCLCVSTFPEQAVDGSMINSPPICLGLSYGLLKVNALFKVNSQTVLYIFG